MSLLCLSFIIQAALVSAMGIFDFEEKVLANNMTPRPSDDVSHPLAEPKQETTTFTSSGQSQVPIESADPMAAIMAADYARENAHLPQPGLNIRKAEDAKPPSVPASTESADPMAAIMAADYARENAKDAASEAGFNFHVLGVSPKDMTHTPSDMLQDSRLTVEESSENAPKEVIGTFGQAPLPAEEVEAKQAKTIVEKADKPLGLSSRKYRNLGATMYHVEPTPRKTMTPEQDALSKERAIQEAVAKHRAASLAARRKEVENVFHTSKEGQSNEATSQVSTGAAPAGILRTLFRLIFLLAGLCSIAGLTYHKYEVIAKMYEGKQGGLSLKLPNFKVKQDNEYGSAQLPRFSPQVSAGSHVSSMVGSFPEGLFRRSAPDTASSCV